MLGLLLDKLGYISKRRLLNKIDILQEISDKTLELHKSQFDNKEITKWNYYKGFWAEQGIISGLEDLKKYIEPFSKE